MSFRLVGLSPDNFTRLYGLGDGELAAHGAQRRIVDGTPGYPDRIELRDLEIGETALLVNYVHQPAATPYRASHAIFVREGARQRFEAVDHVPEALRRRPLSLRAFDADHMMNEALLVTDGSDAQRAIEQLLADERTSYVHVHYATRGCYAARVERA